MPPRRQVVPKGICAYLAEVQEADNVATVPDEIVSLIKRCILDKIFAENPDHVTTCRSDRTSGISFAPTSPNLLTKALDLLNEKKAISGGVPDTMSALDDLINGVIAWAEEDNFEEKKILFFSTLSSCLIKEQDVRNVADKLLTNDVFLSVVLPNKCDMNEVQEKNAKILKSVLILDEYDKNTCVTNLKNARRQILNTNSKKSKRPSPWTVQFEITPDVTIQVSGYAASRKNSAETQRVIVQDTAPENKGTSNGGSGNGEKSATTESPGTEPGTTGGPKPVVIELAKTALTKDILWKTNEGDEVAKDDIGKAYYFADKLIPFNEHEKDDSYESGPRCLKLLAFCPRENVSPFFLRGDGVTEIYPKRDDVESEVKLKSLMKSLIKLDRVAIVRRVYQRYTKVQLGVLVPNEELGCLIFAQLCFADDVSIPSFPELIKWDDKADEEEAETNQKEALIDELIQMKSLDSYHPRDGPSDPNVKIMRELAAEQLYEESETDKDFRKQDTIDICFQGLAVVDDSLSAKIRDAFPLKKNKVNAERLAGKNVFLKRSSDELNTSVELDTKKPKLEDSVGVDLVTDADIPDEAFDDLMDEL